MGSLRVKIYTNGTSSEICNGLKKPLFELLSNFPHPRNYWNGDEISLAHLIRRRGILFWILYCHHHRPIDLKTNKSSVNPHIYVNISVFPFPFIQIILYLMMIILLYLKSVNQWIFISKENKISSVNPLSDFFLFLPVNFKKCDGCSNISFRIVFIPPILTKLFRPSNESEVEEEILEWSLIAGNMKYITKPIKILFKFRIRIFYVQLN